MPTTYLSDRDLASRFGVTRQTIWRWPRVAGFPKPVSLSPGCSRWRLEDVQRWEADRAKRAEVA